MSPLSQYLSRLRFPILVLLLLASVAINVLLSRRLRGFERARGFAVQQERLSIGTVVPSFSAKELTHTNEVVLFKEVDRPTLIYVFTPQCSWCFRNLDNFKTLVERDKAQYRFIGLSLSEDALAAYAVKNQLILPIYSGLSEETKKAYKLSGTPETIVVSPEGKVLAVWMGAWTGKNQTEIESYFHIKLPGLRELPHP